MLQGFVSMHARSGGPYMEFAVVSPTREFRKQLWLDHRGQPKTGHGGGEHRLDKRLTEFVTEAEQVAAVAVKAWINCDAPTYESTRLHLEDSLRKYVAQIAKENLACTLP